MHFDRERHIYFDDNSNKVDSYSQIIKAVNLVYYPPGMKAADRGTEMHTAIELYEKGAWISELQEEHELKAIKAYKKFKETYIKEVIAMEIPFIASSGDESLWAGCADLVFINKKDQICIADMKSGKKYEHHKIQLAAYNLGLMGYPAMGYVIYLDLEECEPLDISKYWDHWMAVYSTYYYKKKRRLYQFDRVLQRVAEYPNQRARDVINEYKDKEALRRLSPQKR